jgi:septal ring-binding cell division protein DamX
MENFLRKRSIYAVCEHFEKNFLCNIGKKWRLSLRSAHSYFLFESDRYLKHNRSTYGIVARDLFMLKSTLFRGAAVISLTALMSACSHSPSASHAYQPPGAPVTCSTNVYLAKYGCSLAKVQTAAENGSADAQYALGYMYFYGIGTVQDKQTAELWIQRSAAQGQPLAKKAWSLIQSGQTSTDFHQQATNELTQRSQSASTIIQQEPSDVNQLNSAVPSQPITSTLPAYNAAPSSGKTSPVIDGASTTSAGTTSTTDTTGSTTTTTGPISSNHKSTDPRLASNSQPVVGTPSRSDDAKMASNQSSNQSDNQSNGYTMQLMASNKLSDVKAFIAQNNLGSAAHYYETKMNGKPWYMLTYGDYRTETQAQMALQEMSSRIQSNHPWVKSLAIVQKEVRNQKVIA